MGGSFHNRSCAPRLATLGALAVAIGLRTLLPASAGSRQLASVTSLFAHDLTGGNQSAARAPGSANPARRDHGNLQALVRKGPIHVRPIRAYAEMVLLNVTVTGPHERVMTGLDRSAFEIYDEKVPQRIAAFSSEDIPISVGLVFDSSGSMASKMEKSREAGVQFLKTATTHDEFLLINFNEKADLISTFTSNCDDLEDQLLTLRAGGATALRDAIYLGLERMREAKTERKALLVISDGGDNHSRYTDREVRRMAQESDVEIYAVGVFEPSLSRRRTQEEARGPSYLSDITESSGGRMFSVNDPSELPRIVGAISRELRNQYVIGYRPSNLVRDGRWRQVKVKLSRNLPHSQVYARAGYYAPTE